MIGGFMDCEYFEVELKNQSKKLIRALDRGLAEFGGQIHATHESRYFTGKLAWRNPATVKVSLPAGSRWAFIRATKIWLARPTKLAINPGMPEPKYTRPICFGQVDHGEMELRRDYILGADPYILDRHPVSGDRVVQGEESTEAILNGTLDLLVPSD